MRTTCGEWCDLWLWNFEKLFLNMVTTENGQLMSSQYVLPLLAASFDNNSNKPQKLRNIYICFGEWIKSSTLWFRAWWYCMEPLIDQSICFSRLCLLVFEFVLYILGMQLYQIRFMIHSRISFIFSDKCCVETMYLISVLVSSVSVWCKSENFQKL